ncbi:Chromate transporter [compost metagenome]
MAGILPLWDRLRSNAAVQRALQGIHAAVVGILLAALYDPIWTSAVFTPFDFVLVLCLFSMLHVWKLPPWCVVISGAAGGLLPELLL